MSETIRRERAEAAKHCGPARREFKTAAREVNIQASGTNKIPIRSSHMGNVCDCGMFWYSKMETKPSLKARFAPLDRLILKVNRLILISFVKINKFRKELGSVFS